MKEEKTANSLFTTIKEEVFKDIEVERVTQMNDDEQLVFMLEQTNRILSDNTLADRFSGMFWKKEEEGRVMSEKESPFFNPESRASMTEDEKLMCAFYLNISGLCFDLYHQIPFDPMTIGIYDAPADFFIDNKPLVKWIETSPYINICMWLAFLMKQQAHELVQSVHYQPAQDYLLKLHTEKYDIVRKPNDSGIEPKEYINTILTGLRRLDNHLAEGAEKGLSNEEIYLYDEITGQISDSIDAPLIPLAKELYNYLHNLYISLDWSERISGARFDEQPTNIQNQIKQFTEQFVIKVKNTRDNNLGKNWLADDSIAMSYLIEHAQCLAIGYFDE